MKVFLAFFLSFFFLIPSAFAENKIQEKEQEIKELSERLDTFDNALKDVQKKLSNYHVGRMKIENVNNIDGLVMLLQEIEQRVQELTGESEQWRFRLESIESSMETLKADYELRFKTMEEQNKAVSDRLTVIETQINKAKEEKKKAEQAKIVAEKKRKEKVAAAAKAEKARKEKIKADYGSKKPKELYDEALTQLNKKEYKGAREKFNAFLELYPKNDLAGNAQYWLGESYYAQGLYDKAVVAFADGYKNYSSGAKAPDLLFKLGITMARLKKTKEACVAFESFEKTYPKVSSVLKKQIVAEKKKLECK